jgi:ABC-type phosphate transport system permease subunit
MVPFMALDNTVALFIVPCALREGTLGFGLSRFATYS